MLSAMAEEMRSPERTVSTFYGYDAAGRVSVTGQCTPRTCGTDGYASHYTYDLAGDLIGFDRGMDMVTSVSYGGHTVGYDTAGRTATVTSTFADASHPQTMFTATQYGPLGLNCAVLGDQSSVYNANTTYSNRGWTTGISYGRSIGCPTGVGAGGTPTTLYSLGLSYNPNGNVKTANDSVNGNWSYMYDGLNRLTAAGQNSQALTYGYDDFGNRLSETTIAGSGPNVSATVDPATNRLTGNGVVYDDMGNAIYDGLMHNFTYDAEGRLVVVDGQTQYVYDAEGKRVAVMSGGSTVKDYLYDKDGRVVTQLDGSGNFVKGELFVDGRHLATYLILLCYKPDTFVSVSVAVAIVG